MKYAREIKVGVLATICLFLLFFGFNFLKGVNIFSPTNPYHGKFDHVHGLEEQAAVYIRGYKIGHVDAIHYDYTQDSAFIVDISINKDIVLPQGTQMALIADGLLGGMAIELQLPEQTPATKDQAPIARGSYLPTTYVPGVIESLQTNLLAHIDEAVQDVDSLVEDIKLQLEGDAIKNSLANIELVSSDLTGVSNKLKYVAANQVPSVLRKADTAIAHINNVVTDIEQANLKATVARVDTAIDSVNALIADVRSSEGTIGKLLYDKSLYQHIDATVVSVDSLVTDVKENPKRYFSLFGKDKKKK